MAKFIFKMENLLSIKQKLEEQEKINYGLAMKKLRDSEETLKLVLEKQSRYEEKLRELFHSVLQISVIKQTEDAIEIVKLDVKRQKIIVMTEEKNVEIARYRLNEAMKERKTFEKLKENAFEKFIGEIKEEEKKEVDELVSYKYGNSNKSEEYE